MHFRAPLAALMNWENLIQLATRAREKAYAPYSQFAVGAALRTRSGQVFVGCNTENISFGLTICAERAAVFSAIAAGERDFEAIVVVADTQVPITPCGACRQVLAEFAPSLPILSSNLSGMTYESTLSVLLPRPKEGILDAPAPKEAPDCST